MPSESDLIPLQALRFGQLPALVLDLREQARILIASTDCAAKVLSNSTVFAGNSPGALRRTTSAPTTSPERTSGTNSRAR
jgi:hypothetical protein